jgi:hypothetical protein
MIRQTINLKFKLSESGNWLNKNAPPIVEELFRSAERMGFEPMIPFWGIHTFQACAIDQLGHLSNLCQQKNLPVILLNRGAKVQNKFTLQALKKFYSETLLPDPEKPGLNFIMAED